MLYVFGVGEVPISMSGDPTQPQPLVHTVRAVGAVTRAICGLKRGAVLGVRGPFGSAWPAAAAVGHDIVLVAGGLGLAPLRPMLYHVLAHRQQYGQVVLLYGARTPEELLYRRQLEHWRARFDMEVLVTVDRATGTWQGSVGVVTKLIAGVVPSPDSTIAMTCGPEVMMRFVARELMALGVPERRIFISIERNMKCGVGLCGHCQLGPYLLCRDGPTLSYDRVAPLLTIREL